MTRTILVVEDTDLGRDVIEAALMTVPECAGTNGRHAEEALRCLAEDDVCALVTDLHLPHMDGFELIEAVRAQPRRSSLPILVISGDSDPAHPRACWAWRERLFLEPYSPAEVRSRLEQLIDAS